MPFMTQNERDRYHAHLSDQDAQWLNRKLMAVQAHMLNIMRNCELSGETINSELYICTNENHHQTEDIKSIIDNF